MLGFEPISVRNSHSDSWETLNRTCLFAAFCLSADSRPASLCDGRLFLSAVTSGSTSLMCWNLSPAMWNTTPPTPTPHSLECFGFFSLLPLRKSCDLNMVCRKTQSHVKPFFMLSSCVSASSYRWRYGRTVLLIFLGSVTPVSLDDPASESWSALSPDLRWRLHSSPINIHLSLNQRLLGNKYWKKTPVLRHLLCSISHPHGATSSLENIYWFT